MLVDLFNVTGEKKDAVSMKDAFKALIEKIEAEYNVVIYYLCTDNDGGSKAGRKLLQLALPWLFIPPCCSHQVCRHHQLIVIGFNCVPSLVSAHLMGLFPREP